MRSLRTSGLLAPWLRRSEGRQPRRRTASDRARPRSTTLATIEQLEERLPLTVEVGIFPMTGVNSSDSHYAVLLVNDGSSGFLKKNPDGNFSYADNAQFVTNLPNQVTWSINQNRSDFGSLSTFWVTSGTFLIGDGPLTSPEPGTTMFWNNTETEEIDVGTSDGIVPGTFRARLAMTDGDGNSGSVDVFAGPEGGNNLRFQLVAGNTALPQRGSMSSRTGSISITWEKAPEEVTLIPFSWAVYTGEPDDPRPLSFTLFPGQTPDQRLQVDLTRTVSTVSIDTPLTASRGNESDPNRFGSPGSVALAGTNVVINANTSSTSRFLVGAEEVSVNRPVAAPAHTLVVSGTPEDPGRLLVSEQGALAGSVADPTGTPAGTVSVTARHADVILAGTVNAGQQTYLMQSPDDPRGYSVTTVSPTSGQQSGRIRGNTVVMTLANDAGGDVDVRTTINTLRITASSTATSPVLPYTIRVAEADDLVIDSVPASLKPIDIRANGELILESSVQTSGDVALSATKTLTLSAPVSSAAGNVLLVSDAVVTQSPVVAGGNRGVVIVSRTSEGDVAVGAQVRAGGAVKAPVRVASNTDIDLVTGGLLVVDGVTLAAGDRVLVKNQSVASENGIYVAGEGGWQRASDASSPQLLPEGFVTFVIEGSQRGSWTFANQAPPLVGQTPLLFVPTAATQAYAPVKAATIGNVDLLAGGLPEVDGVVIEEGDRVLVRAQANPRQNGLYVASEGPWQRASDANTVAELRAGSYVFVQEGTVNGERGFVLLDDAVQIGTTPLAFGPYQVQATRTNLYSPANVLVPVAAATTTSIVLVGLQAVDGVTLADGDRVLVKNQLPASANGVYLARAGAWERAADAASPAGLARGSVVFVVGGTENGRTGWEFDDTVTAFGTTAVGSQNVTGLVSTAGLRPGMLVSGPGIPSNAEIAAITGPTSIRLSLGATVANPTTPLVFLERSPVVIGTTPITFLPVGGTVAVASGRSITDGGSAASRLQGSAAVLVAGRPVSGTADPTSQIDAATRVGRLSAAAPGAIDIVNDGAVELFDLRTTADGPVAIEASGGITAILLSSADAVTLTSTFGDVVAAGVTGGRGDIALTTLGGNVLVQAVGPTEANVNARDGSVVLSATRSPGETNGNVRIAGRVAAEGENADVRVLSAEGRLEMASTAIIAAADQLDIFTPGAAPLIEPGAQITATRLAITAPFGPGSTGPSPNLGTYQVLEVNRTDPGDIDITSGSSLKIEGASTTSGSIRFAAPDLVIAGSIQPVGPTSDITLVAPAGKLSVDAPLTAPRDITLEATAGSVGSSTGAATPLLSAGGTLVVRAATAANVVTKVQALDAVLTGMNATLNVRETDDLTITQAILAGSGTVDLQVGTPATGGSARAGLIDAGPAGTVRITAAENILEDGDPSADIRAARAELVATTGRIAVDTDVATLVLAGLQKNQPAAVNDVGTGPTPLTVESGPGNQADTSVTARRTIRATKVDSSGQIALATLDPGSDILVGDVAALGNAVSLSARGSIRELGPVDPAPDVRAATVSLLATDGSIDLHLDATGVAAKATSTGSTIRIRDDNDLSVGDGKAGIDGRTVTLVVGGTLRQTAPIAADFLDVPATGGDITLGNPLNAVQTLRMVNGTRAITFANGRALSITELRGGAVSLSTAGNLTQTGPITAAALTAAATANYGTVYLDNPGNAVGSVSGTTTLGHFVLVNGGGVNVGPAGITAATAAPGDGEIWLIAPTGNVTIGGSLTAINDIIRLSAPNGRITQTAGSVTAQTLVWTAQANPTWLPGQPNVSVIAPNLTVPGDLVIGPVSGPLTVAWVSTVDGNITIQNDDDVILEGVIRAGGAGKVVNLSSTNGRVDGEAAIIDASAVTLSARSGPGADRSWLGVFDNVPVASATVSDGDLVLISNGVLRQTGPITVSGAVAAIGGKSIVLDNPANSVGAIGASTLPGGSITFVNAASFAVGGVTAGSLDPDGAFISLEARTGNMVLAGPVTAGDDSVVLRAPQGLIVDLAGSSVVGSPVIRQDATGETVTGPFRVTTGQGLASTVALINGLPRGPGLVYQVVVAASFALDGPITVSNALEISGAAPGITLSGSPAAANGLLFNSLAAGSRITNLAFAGFSGTAVHLNAVRGAAVSGLRVNGSGLGLALSGDSTGTTVTASTFEANTTAISLDGVRNATLGSTVAADRNRIVGPTDTGVFATGFCTGTRLIQTVFSSRPPVRVQYNTGSSRNLSIEGTIVE